MLRTSCRGFARIQRCVSGLSDWRDSTPSTPWADALCPPRRRGKPVRLLSGADRNSIRNSSRSKPAKWLVHAGQYLAPILSAAARAYRASKAERRHAIDTYPTISNRSSAAAGNGGDDGSGSSRRRLSLGRFLIEGGAPPFRYRPGASGERMIGHERRMPPRAEASGYSAKSDSKSGRPPRLKTPRPRRRMPLPSTDDATARGRPCQRGRIRLCGPLDDPALVPKAPGVGRP